MSPEVQNRGISGLTKRTDVLQKFEKRKISRAGVTESSELGTDFELKSLSDLFPSVCLDPNRNMVDASWTAKVTDWGQSFYTGSGMSG